jgi:hypothetical protein
MIKRGVDMSSGALALAAKDYVCVWVCGVLAKDAVGWRCRTCALRLTSQQRNAISERGSRAEEVVF